MILMRIRRSKKVTLKARGRHLGKIGYGDVPLVRFPFIGSEDIWQGPKFTNFQDVYLTRTTFGYFEQFSGQKLERFSTFRLTFSDFWHFSRWIWENFSLWQGPNFTKKSYLTGPIFQFLAARPRRPSRSVPPRALKMVHPLTFFYM